jgi:phosphatidylglycerophosphate synthase
VSKPVEVEELVDLRFHRPLAARLLPFLLKTPITPNQVTLLSGITGVLAGVAIGLGAARPHWRLASAVLLLVSVILDCCDGQLARARGISSTTGAILDGVADYIVGAAMAIGASYYMVVTEQSAWFWLLGLLGAASSAVQSALFDHTKTRYIAKVAGGYSEREEDLERIARDREAAKARQDRLDMFLLWLYERYSRAQHAALRIAPVNDPVAYRQENSGRMRAWTWLGIGTHFALAYVLTALSVLWEEGPTAYMVICATVLNVYLVALMAIEPRRVGE